ncbi:DapH/DapD/GlmU-related protein [uncultured Sphingomonas sp.]|uniref:acyltransferase n=1 Tax=uncultured Sphingomonas sp. TaxID=158754 RepID=UPI0030FA9DA1
MAIINAIASTLPDDPFTSRLRAHLYRLISCRSGRAPTIKGGCRVNGYGLRIGHRVFINRSCYFDLSAPVVLGDNVVVGHHTRFVTADHEVGTRERRAGSVKAAPIVVEEGAWIGCQCVIMPDVTIGRGSVVAAGALVRESVPPNVMVAGVPARVKTLDLDAALAAE